MSEPERTQSKEQGGTMSNEQLIKSAHIWALALLLLCCVVVAFAGTSISGSQNSNQQSSNTQTGNKNNSDNQNSSKNPNAVGERAAMTNLSAADSKFIMEAAMGGLMEVELGRLATQKGSSAAVKEFGQRMVDDHSAANTELMQLASTKGITLPTELDEKHRKEVTRMSNFSGAEFDRMYSKSMLSDHMKDVAAFEKQSSKGTDKDIKTFANKTLPTLKEHLELAKALNGSSSGGMKTGNSNRP